MAELLKIYPNPSQGEVTLEKDHIGQQTELFINDVTGRQILTQSIVDTHTTISSNSLKPGVYLFQVIRDHQLVGTGRLIIE